MEHLYISVFEEKRYAWIVHCIALPPGNFSKICMFKYFQGLFEITVGQAYLL